MKSFGKNESSTINIILEESMKKNLIILSKAISNGTWVRVVPSALRSCPS